VNPEFDPMNAEQQRLEEDRAGRVAWRRWGPFLSERQWGTVREDHSPGGAAWDYLPHDQARSRAYRWGEVGLAGFSDDEQRVCLSLTLWNCCDPNADKLQNDPHFRDCQLFQEHFHDDNGRGIGASHQTGWTGLVAKILQPRRKYTLECR
jgi:hypothetical protein